MAAKEVYVAGALVLTTDSSVKLHDMLANDGQVMEYISGLFVSSAEGLMQAEMLGISSKLDVLPELIQKINDLTELVNNISAMRGVVNNATPQNTSVQTTASVKSEINQSSLEIAAGNSDQVGEIVPSNVVKNTAASMGALMTNMKKFKSPK